MSLPHDDSHSSDKKRPRLPEYIDPCAIPLKRMKIAPDVIEEVLSLPVPDTWSPEKTARNRLKCAKVITRQRCAARFEELERKVKLEKEAQARRDSPTTSPTPRDSECWELV